MSIILLTVFLNTSVLLSQAVDYDAYTLKLDVVHCIDTLLAIKIHPKLPNYLIRVTINDSSGWVSVFKKHDHSVDTINIIPLLNEYDDSWSFPSFFPKTVLIIDDFNLDNYLDLAIMDAEDIRRGTPYYSIWLFDCQSGLYIENENYSGNFSFSYSIDKVAKTITTDRVDELYYENCVTNVFRIVNNTLILIRIETVRQIDYSDTLKYPDLDCTIEELFNGQMRQTKHAVLHTPKELKQFFKK